MRHTARRLFLWMPLLVFALFIASYSGIIKKRKPKKQIDVIGVGFPKSGTSIFFDELGEMPHIHRLSRVYDVEHKILGPEVNFFGDLSTKSSVTIRKTENYKKKVFRPAKHYYRYLLSEDKINVEKSPQYIWKESTLKEIAKFNPNVKIVVNIRKPADWLWSYYNHCKSNKLNGVENHSFESFLEEVHPESGISPLHSAIYSNYIKTIYKYFPKENVYIIPCEELKQIETVNQLCDLLGLPKQGGLNLQTRFKDMPSYREKVGTKLYNELNDFYRPYNEELFELIGRRINSWEDPISEAN